MAGDAKRAGELGAELKNLAGVLGVLSLDPAAWFQAGTSSISDARIQELIDSRTAARKAKNWAESDRIRDELKNAGVILEDKPGGGTTWRRA